MVVGMDSSDLTPDQRLDQLFAHEELEEPWQSIYREMVAQLRAEAAGLPMNTVQHLLIERIAYDYVYIRIREEEMRLGDNTSTFNRPNVHKEYNNFWLDMTKEFHKQLTSGNDKLREALLMEVQAAVQNAVNTVKDPETRQSLRRTLSEEFARIDAPGVSR